MTAATLQFGPEWMRTKPQTPRSQAAPSPPLQSSGLPAASSYSSLVTPAPQPPEEKRESSNPFKYSKEDMLRIYKEGGGRGGLGLEVERWEGIVREVGSEPAALKEWTEAEKKLFAGSLNSEMRRRQSTDYLGSSAATSLTGERPRLAHNSSGGVSPMRERFGSLMGRRRGDSTDQQPSIIPRKLSVSGIHGALNGPREGALPSPRTRVGFTQGFDGVLNGGDSWNLRRRPSEGPLRANSISMEHGEMAPQSDGQRDKIKEEEESAQAHGDRTSSEQSSATTSATGTPAAQDNKANCTSETTAVLDNGIASLSSGDSSNNAGGSVSVHPDNKSSGLPGLSDLVSIEWSYLDPQGQVQGPFRADVMQKWHDEGYFTPDLLMKRTHIDTEWTSVGELALRAGGGQIFLSPLVQSTAPPGLPRRSEPSADQLLPPRDPVMIAQPYQPVPLRSLRTSTLDSYLNGSPSVSASPSSSLGAGRFSNGSPDPAAFGNNVQNNLYAAGDPSMGARGARFGAPRESQPISDRQFRGGYNDTSFDSSYLPAASPFERTLPNRASSIDSFGYGPMGHGRFGPDGGAGFTGEYNGLISDSPYISPAIPMNANGLAGVRGLSDSGIGPLNSPGSSGMPFAAQRSLSHLSRDALSRHGLPESPAVDNVLNGHGPSFGPLPQTPSFPQSPPSQLGSQQSQALAPLAAALAQSSVGPPPPNVQHSQGLQQSLISGPSPRTPSSSWNVQEQSPSRRPNPFDAPLPKTGNTSVNATQGGAISSSGSVAPFHQQPRRTASGNSATPSQPQPQHEQSPWYTASRGIVEDGWGDPSGANRLTVSNLMQHNEQQEQQAERTPSQKDSPEPMEPPAVVVEPSPVQPTVPAATGDKVVSKKKASQKTTQGAPAEAAEPAPVPSSTASATPTTANVSSSVAPPKPAWSIGEEKAKPSGVAMGFREIQEAEAKRLEARKVAEKEKEDRERLSKANASSTSEESPPFVASWGLPTSKAGAARTVSQAPKESAAPATSPPQAAAPWTNAVKPVTTKKTMKEIQEEEERRKKEAAKQKESMATAARRGYAETTTRSTPVTPATIGGPWAMVGPGGKVSTPGASATATPASRPSLPTSTSTPAVASATPRSVNSVNAVARNGGGSSVPAAAKAAPGAKAEDVPAVPSAELLKWMSDSLKGLDSSVNLEEIISMLLTFPLDPDPSTLELISELIYANSTTMDGRRFAADFVSRRKLDASSRGKTNGMKAPSIADVVKAQPKPAQNDGWGGFKVVNKKKKGGKS
ncbi:hypothetical protein GLOTRDRAFT_113569 [Gloeophyllum trabeum ATCC 11539]|uniref:GYF domain-containing protein n=1 Tax=Gloeophyllum trabeum (strain ATCC 11539 / FP-39264 / Madison 617) TaxID=670483 RepID=S7S144_GLOTA|nr:uncharacterized protein GLOTRDRAFT_113569 [Gloeophyllum trabeum ATCC 11539]EPQ61120.1 hypothetical protein GLOTRDRAFT_113569 [Gloeophyllum trabeum ATCC 11539]